MERALCRFPTLFSVVPCTRLVVSVGGGLEAGSFSSVVVFEGSLSCAGEVAVELSILPGCW
ncbi:hypothetical protein NDU88_008887, partial [Pleurodeles waltl]